MEEERWEREEKEERVDLDVNYRSLSSDIPKEGRERGKRIANRAKKRERKKETRKKRRHRQHSQRQARLDGAELVALVVNKAVTLLSH